MRGLAYLAAVPVIASAACTDSYHDLSIDPAGGPPLGIGLTQRYDVTQELCEGGIDGSCGNPAWVPTLQATVDSSAIAALNLSTGQPSSFELTGVAAGTVTVALTGFDDITNTFPIAVAPVAETTLFVNRTYDAFWGPGFPDVLGPIRAFADGDLLLGQRHLGADHSPRSGTAPVAIDAGGTAIRFDATCDCYRTGHDLGTATLSTPLATLEIDVVDATAISSFALDGAATSTIELVNTLGTNEVFLIPSDATGTQIVGAGPEPTFTIADRSVVTLGANIPRIGMRSFTLYTLNPGTTTLEITWGGVQRTFMVHVVP